MDCDYDYDGDPSEFESLTDPKARKEHKCSDCGGTIRIGERYEYFACKFNGEIHVEKRCADCRFIVHEVGSSIYEACGGWRQDWRGMLSEAWAMTCDGIVDDKNYLTLAPIACRIVGMQRAACAARGGNKLWSVPEDLTPEYIKELQADMAS